VSGQVGRKTRVKLGRHDCHRIVVALIAVSLDGSGDDNQSNIAGAFAFYAVFRLYEEEQ
jgi:hypothetical protein